MQRCAVGPQSALGSAEEILVINYNTRIVRLAFYWNQAS
jgi:hypothetical protein